MGIAEDRNRYLAAAHAMQSGVAAKMRYDPNETSEKHLRTGVNSAMVETSALVKLLISKGIITEAEWYAELADAMEREKEAYEKALHNILGTRITLS